MRLFVGIALDPALQSSLSFFQSELENFDVSPVTPENLHFTLKFLGEIDEDKVEFIKNTLKNISEEHTCFPITLEGVGSFPETGFLRVIWVGVTEGKESLRKIGNLIMSALNSIKEDDHKFEPHLTLARVKNMNNKNNLFQFLEKYKQVRVGSMQVQEIVLYESVLTRSGPVYEIIEKYPLSYNK